MKKIQRNKKIERGQSLVEFALFLPILVLLVLGMIDLTSVFYRYIAVVGAAREGAAYYGRYINTTGFNVSSVCTAVQNELGATKPISLANDVACSDVTTTATTSPTPSTTPSSVSVTVKMHFTPLVPGLYEYFPNYFITYTASYPQS